jgi:hypothetical protein
MIARPQMTSACILLGLAALAARAQEPPGLPLLAPPSNAPAAASRSETARVQDQRPAESPLPAAPEARLLDDEPTFEELPLPPGEREVRRSEFPVSPAAEPREGDSPSDLLGPPPRPRAAIGDRVPQPRGWDADRGRATGEPRSGLRDPLVLRLNRLGLEFYFDPSGQRRWGPPAGRDEWGDPPSFLEPPSALDDPDAQRPVFDRPATLTERLRQEQPVRRRPLRRLMGRLRN